jgi:lipoate-protein ligase A
MAVDEALLLSHAAHQTPPTVRFYDWQPTCVSLGRFQKFDEARALAIRERGFDLVRRPTGGRAVLHQHEITYCIVVNADLLPVNCRSVIGSYRWLSQGFAAGLSDLGIDAALAKASPNPSRNIANCFSSAAQCDFLVEDRKLIGAAQCRKNGAILQHGSLLLDIDNAAWVGVLGGSMNHTASLRALGITGSRTAVIEALCRGLERSLQVSLEQSVLGEAEIAVASRLHKEKYSATDRVDSTCPK